MIINQARVIPNGVRDLHRVIPRFVRDDNSCKAPARARRRWQIPGRHPLLNRINKGAMNIGRSQYDKPLAFYFLI